MGCNQSKKQSRQNRLLRQNSNEIEIATNNGDTGQTQQSSEPVAGQPVQIQQMNGQQYQQNQNFSIIQPMSTLFVQQLPPPVAAPPVAPDLVIPMNARTGITNETTYTTINLDLNSTAPARSSAATTVIIPTQNFNLNTNIASNSSTDPPPAQARQSAAQLQQRSTESDTDNPFECPLCMEEKPDILPLIHASQEKINQNSSSDKSNLNARNILGDISNHKACADCRAALLRENRGCPWCRDVVIYREVFGLLEELKNEIKSANVTNNPQVLANLMSKWLEYEMGRNKYDVIRFAKDLILDPSLSILLTDGINKNPAWLRDSCGLWVRLLALIEGGEISIYQWQKEHSEKLQQAVDKALDFFDTNGGGSAPHAGAMYTQLCVALLCSEFSNTSTHTIIPRVQRVGRTCVKYWGPGSKRGGGGKEIKNHMAIQYVQAVSEVVWGSVAEDPVLLTFFLT